MLAQALNMSGLSHEKLSHLPGFQAKPGREITNDGTCRVLQEYNGTDLRSTGFAFYINRSGRRSQENVLVHWEVHWEGVPTSFS